MSGPRQPAIQSAGAIDAVSRHRAAWFAIRLLGLAALAFGPCLAGTRPVQDAASLMSLACSMGGFVSMVFAQMRHDPFWRGGLNGWDEALAFVAASQLAHFIMTTQS